MEWIPEITFCAVLGKAAIIFLSLCKKCFWYTLSLWKGGGLEEATQRAPIATE